MLVFFLLWKLLTIKQRPLPSTNHMKSTVSSIHLQLWWFFFGHFISANTHFTDSSADWRIKVLLVHQTQSVHVGCVLFAPVAVMATTTEKATMTVQFNWISKEFYEIMRIGICNSSSFHSIWTFVISSEDN